jgi:predicted PurR-regulated permease PerM
VASEDVAVARADDHVAQVEAADLAKLADHAVPSRPALRSASLPIMASLAVVYTLYFGKELLLPMTLALLFKLLLQAPMRFLTRRLRLPDPVAALAMILAVFGCLALVALTVSVPASGWIGKAPASLAVLQEKLAVLRRPLEALQDVLHGLEDATTPAAPAEGGQTVTVQDGGALFGQVFSGTALMLSRSLTTVIMLFFLLSSGDRLLRGLVELMPRFQEKRQVVEITAEIEENISAYLLTITLMNALVGVATGLAMWSCGLGDPLLWGAAAFLLNFIPILGPLVGVGMFFAAGLLTLAWPWQALLPAGLYLLIHLAEGETITPLLLANQFTLNPVLVIVSLFFWHTIWGIPGAFLAVPMLAMAKIVCDRVVPLQPLGHIIGS